MAGAIACVFPGQGSQYVGMGQDLHQAYPVVRQAFARASVLSNEKYRGMRLQLSENLIKATVHNPEQEEAEEELEVEYSGDEFEIGFNVAYFIDALAAIRSDTVQVHFIDANHSCLVNGEKDSTSKYVIMPMRL